MFSVEEYKLALTLARSEMHDMHYAMLRTQYSAPNRTLTVPQLATAIGYASFSGVNLHYGKLGRLLATVLGQFPKRRKNGTYSWWRVLSSGGYVDNAPGFHWTMHSALATALEELGLVKNRYFSLADCEQLLSQFDYQRDVRRPPDNLRKGRFQVGWKDAVSQNKHYTKYTLKRLTWHNLGYRLGKRFGQKPPDQIEEIYELFSQHYKITASRATQEQEIEKTVIADLEAIQDEEELFEEGKGSRRFINHYERNPKLRAAAILHHGTSCMVCGFDFGKTYGEHGDGYIEVHHKVPVSSLKVRTRIDPKTDMAVLCSNCHRMIHRKKEKILSIEELEAFVRQTEM